MADSAAVRLDRGDFDVRCEQRRVHLESHQQEGRPSSLTVHQEPIKSVHDASEYFRLPFLISYRS